MVSDGTLRNGDGSTVGTYAAVAGLAANTPYQITVTMVEGAGNAHVELYAGLAPADLAVVPSNWLSPDARVLPAGWSLNTAAGQDAEYASARAESGQIVLNRVDGDAVAFEKSGTGAGYVPPASITDQVTLLADGSVQVNAADGGVYRFLTTGQLDTYTPPVDAGTATTPTATWATLPGSTAQRLTAQTDPISGRSLAYTYHGGIGGTCPAAPSGFLAVGTSSLNGLLCTVTRADGAQTQLFYQADGAGVIRLARVVNPGNQIADFQWTKPQTKVVLTAVRTPYLSDLVAAGKIAATDLWTLGYTSDKITSVTAPKASATATTQEGIASISWASTTETTLKVRNLDTLHGAAAWDRRVIFDGQARWTGDWSARGATTAGSTTNSLERTAAWHVTADVMLESRDHGRMTTYVYDSHLWLTDTYGPANVSCFNITTRTPNGTCTAPPVAHTHTDYDTVLLTGGGQSPMTGLAATNFATNNFSGRPVSLGTVAQSGGFNINWGAGAPAGVGVVDNWSTRLVGDINLPVAGNWGFWITMADGSDQAALYIDDLPVITLQAGANWPCCGFVSYGTVPTSLTAGVHRLRIDFLDGGGTALIQINWDKPGVGNEVVPASALAPRYGLPTRVTVDDSNGAPLAVTHTRYDQNGWDPAYGLATSTIVDPAGQALTTSTAYDTLRRRTGRTLPAGNTTTYTFYGNTEASPAIVCADGSTIAGGVNQAGAIKTATSPAPVAGTAVAYTTVYDLVGRPVATRVGTEAWTCTFYDARGRSTKTVYPANTSYPARTVTTTFSDTVDPQTVVIADPAGSVTTKTDFLGRTIEYTDTTGAANKTTTVYDTAGRVARTYGTTIGATATSAGLEYVYDRGGFVTQVKLDGQPVASPSYTTGVLGGELSAVAYPSGTGNGGNGTNGTISRNTAGAVTGLSWTGPASSAITANTVTRSQSGRVVDQTIDGVDAYTAGNNFVYDTAGRLTDARAQNGTRYQYSFAASGGCGVATAAGKNTNRTAALVNGTSVATFCYDNADRLTSATSTTAPYNTYASTIGYDAHGNTTTLGGETLAYDQANRHMATYKPTLASPTTGKVIYQRDALDQIISRTVTTGSGTQSTIAWRAAASASSGANAGTSITVTKPSGTVAGDVMVAGIVANGGSGVTITAPAGWVLQRTENQLTSTATAVFTKVAGASEPASYAFTLSASKLVVGSISTYTGVDTANPVDGAGGANSGTSSTAISAPSVTTTTSNTRVIAVWGVRGATTFTPVTPVLERTDIATTGSFPMSMSLGDRARSTAGATGTSDATASMAGFQATVTIALRAATTGATTELQTYSQGAVLNASGVVVERSIGLPGGATLTKPAVGDVWSYPNIHGDVQAVANATGLKQGATFTYDPYGTPLAGLPDNAAGSSDNGWLGQHNRPSEHIAGMQSMIEMGARAYQPILGRFLEVDPIEGGSCNDYDYVCSDPNNAFDLDGRTKCGKGQQLVYWAFDQLQNIIYVGRTNNTQMRWGKHGRTPGRKDWTFQEISDCMPAVEARIFEDIKIRLNQTVKAGGNGRNEIADSVWRRILGGMFRLMSPITTIMPNPSCNGPLNSALNYCSTTNVLSA
jgi:RHS repeat-associated protein